MFFFFQKLFSLKNNNTIEMKKVFRKECKVNNFFFGYMLERGKCVY